MCVFSFDLLRDYLMAELKQSRAKLLAVAAAVLVFLSTGMRICPQSPSSSLAGKLANLHSVPLAEVTRPVREFPPTEALMLPAKLQLPLSQPTLLIALPVIDAATPSIEPASQSDPAAPAVTTTLSAEEVQSLPASGRRWEDFVLDTPASAAPAGSSETSLRGAGEQSSDVSVDGASIQLAFGGGSSTSPGSAAQSSSGQGLAEPSGMARAWSGGRSFAVSEAAVRSVQVVSGNAGADGARAAGGRVNVETQRGSAGFHGQGFLFDRQNTWGARNPFTQWVQQTAPATANTVPVFTPAPFTPPDHEIKWGIGAGSQIRRKKLSWFAALDSYDRNDPALSTVKWPGNFFAQPTNDQVQLLGAQLETNNNSALAQYSKMLQTLDGLLGPSPRTATQYTAFARIDWQAAERHRLTLEGTGADWNAPGGGLTRVSETYGKSQPGIGPGQPAMAACPLGSLPDTQPAGRHPGLHWTHHPKRKA